MQKLMLSYCLAQMCGVAQGLKLAVGPVLSDCDGLTNWQAQLENLVYAVHSVQAQQQVHQLAALQ